MMELNNNIGIIFLIYNFSLKVSENLSLTVDYQKSNFINRGLILIDLQGVPKLNDKP